MFKYHEQLQIEFVWLLLLELQKKAQILSFKAITVSFKEIYSEGVYLESKIDLTHF